MSFLKWGVVVLVVTGCLVATAWAGEKEFKPEDGWVQLFNGKDLTGWKQHGNRTSWKVEDGVMANTSGHGKDRGVNIHCEKTFKDFELHIEFKVPKGGNSGVYLRGRKEIQVHDSYGVAKPGSGHCGGIYSKAAPKVNACKPTGEWQSFDVTIVGDKITAHQNGQLIHDGVEVPGHTGGSMGGQPGTPGPIMLQGDHSTVYYRNIWVRPIEEKK